MRTVFVAAALISVRKPSTARLAAPIVAQEIVRAERWTDGHILTIEGRPKDRIVEGQVALFNSIPYQIPLCRDYRGEWFAKGHHFHTEDWTASELRVEIAGEGFDPASLA
jgi:hypothetical protein